MSQPRVRCTHAFTPFHIKLDTCRVGYGDITPASLAEIWLNLAIQISGLALFTTILSSIQEILTATSRQARRDAALRSKLTDVQVRSAVFVCSRAREQDCWFCSCLHLTSRQARRDAALRPKVTNVQVRAECVRSEATEQDRRFDVDCTAWWVMATWHSVQRGAARCGAALR